MKAATIKASLAGGMLAVAAAAGAQSHIYRQDVSANTPGQDYDFADYIDPARPVWFTTPNPSPATDYDVLALSRPSLPAPVFEIIFQASETEGFGRTFQSTPPAGGSTVLLPGANEAPYYGLATMKSSYPSDQSLVAKDAGSMQLVEIVKASATIQGGDAALPGGFTGASFHVADTLGRFNETNVPSTTTFEATVTSTQATFSVDLDGNGSVDPSFEIFEGPNARRENQIFLNADRTAAVVFDGLTVDAASGYWGNGPQGQQPASAVSTGARTLVPSWAVMAAVENWQQYR